MLDDLDSKLAQRLLRERQRREWSLGDLAERSGVSKAMLSKIERGEASPTAALLARIASAFGQTLAQFLSFDDRHAAGFVRSLDLPVWRDPQTGYTRRQVFLDAGHALELVEVVLPPGASVAFPADVYLNNRHVVWALDGRLTLREGEVEHRLEAGDRLAFGPPSEIVYCNGTEGPCRYLVAVTKA